MELMPGRNGGQLRRGGGNTVNVGRKKNEVRAKYLEGAGSDAKYIRDVARGKPVVLVPPAGKNAEPTFRYPSFDERRWAQEQCLRYGLGTQDSVELLIPEEFASVLGEVLGEEESLPMDLIERVVSKLIQKLKD